MRQAADVAPRGDQPEAICQRSAGLREEVAVQDLPGMTGSGKTLTMVHIIAETNPPMLAIGPGAVNG